MRDRMVDEMNRHRATIRQVTVDRSTRSRTLGCQRSLEKKLTRASSFLECGVPVVRDRISRHAIDPRSRPGGAAGRGDDVAGDVAPRTSGHADHDAGLGRHRGHDERGERGDRRWGRRDRPRQDRRGRPGRRARGEVPGGGSAGRPRPGHPAGAHQHAHARADGAVPGPGRRPGPHGLAPALHLPGRSQDRLPGFRPRRHAAGRARDDRVGHDHVRRHVLLRRRHRGGHARGGAPRRARPIRHPVSRRGCEDAGGGAGPGRGLHPEMEGRPARHARRRPARAQHGAARDAQGGARPREQVQRAAPHPSGRDTR